MDATAIDGYIALVINLVTSYIAVRVWLS